MQKHINRLAGGSLAAWILWAVQTITLIVGAASALRCNPCPTGAEDAKTWLITYGVTVLALMLAAAWYAGHARTLQIDHIGTQVRVWRSMRVTVKQSAGNPEGPGALMSMLSNVICLTLMVLLGELRVHVFASVEHRGVPVPPWHFWPYRPQGTSQALPLCTVCQILYPRLYP